MSMSEDKKDKDKKFETPTIILNRDGTFGKTEEYKRSEHNDFATSKELKDRKFCGIRHNSITETREIWVIGEIRGRMDEATIAMNPWKWELLYAEVFGLVDVKEVTGKGN